MIHVCRAAVLAMALLTLAIICSDGPARAQGTKDGAKGEPVKITTVDGVDLHGMFFPSSKKDAPTVILLHTLGENGHNKNYLSFAEGMQGDYSVMTFDFRGHGKSKDIDPAIFRKFPQNQRIGNGKKTTIEFTEFGKEYYPVLCNDIAAVKAFLDRKNDTGACNTSSTILVGAETGATLGAIWLNAQWSLYRLVPNAIAGLAPQIAKDSEGKDVIACVWLSISPKLGSHDITLSRALAVPVKLNGTATVFIYGDQDSEGKSRALALEKALKDTKDPKHRYIASYAVDGNTKLKGMKLLSPELKTKKEIALYLDEVVSKKGAESIKRDFRTTDFVWRAGGVPAPAKTRAIDMNNFLFETYAQFLGR